jgi:hypothetical protein
MFDWLFKKKEPTVPQPQAPEDLALLNCMHNCTIKGKLTLPSGFTLEAAPPGHVWKVNAGKITLAAE